MKAIFCECSVTYDGRANTHLPTGNRLVLIKGDTVTVHKTDEGVKPVNYMQDANLTTNNDTMIIAQRTSPDETLEIDINTIDNVIQYGGDSTEELTLTGTEDELQEYLAHNPSAVHPEYTHFEREYETGAGPVDLYGEINDCPTLVEVKKSADVSSVGQLSRYVHATDEDRVNAILAYNNTITRKAEDLVGTYENMNLVQFDTDT